MTTGRSVDFSSLVTSRCEGFVGRSWLRRDIRAFVNADADERVLLLHGEPGAGKTSILAWAVREMRAAHFFFGRTDGLGEDQGGGWSEPVRCAETVGTQLVAAFGDDVAGYSRIGLQANLHIGSAIGDTTGIRIGEMAALPSDASKPLVAVRHKVERAASGTVHRAIEIYQLSIDPMLAMQELLVGPLRRAAAKTPHRVVLVLDGLDEWDRTAAPTDILELLQSSDLPRNVRVIASARPSYLSRVRPEVVTIDISGGSQEDNDSDISELVAAIASEKNLEMTTDCRLRVIQHSQGNFLIASCLLNALASGDLSCDALPALPPGLETLYQRSLARLSDELGREGLGAALGPILSVLCVAREPLDASLIAKASGISEETVRNVLGRLRAFVRTVHELSVARFIPFHLSFSEFLRVGDLITGASGELGHLRLTRGLIPSDPSDLAWIEASDYAVRHATAHCHSVRAASSSQLNSLINDPRYLVERVFRLGTTAFGEDERLARQGGLDAASLHSIAIELAVHARAASRPRASVAQDLAVIASAVGADGLATRFAQLASSPLRLVPRWSAGKDTVKFAATALRAGSNVKSATLLRQRLTLVLDDMGIEIWDLEMGVRIHSMTSKERVRYAVAEPNGDGLWCAYVDYEADTSRVVHLAIPGGHISKEFRLEHTVTCLAIDDEGLFVIIGTESGRVQLLDSRTAQAIGHRDTGSYISSLQIRDRQAFVLTRRRKVVSWHIPSLERVGMALADRLTERPSFSNRTDGLAVSSDGTRVWMGGNDGNVMEANLDDSVSITIEKIVQLGGWADHLSRITDGHLAVGDSTGRLYFIDVAARRSLASIRCHPEAPRLVQYCEPLDLVATVSERGEIALWRKPSAKLSASIGHEGEVKQIIFSRVESRLFSVGDDGALHEWDERGDLIQRAYLKPTLFETVKLANDANTLVTSKNSIRKFALTSLDTEFLRSEPWYVEIMDKCQSVWKSDPLPIAISADGSLAVRCTRDSVEVWNVDSEHLALRLDEETHPGSDPISLDGAWLTTRGKTGKLLIRAIDNVENPTELESDGLIAGPFWTIDGLLVLSTCMDYMQCHAIDEGKPRLLWTLGRCGSTHGVASPDGKLCAVFDSSGQVSILRASDGVAIGGFRGRVPITCAAFNAAGDRLAVGDAGGGVQMLGLEYRKEQFGA